MGYKPHPPSSRLLIGYDPEVDLAQDHLARFVDKVVERVPVPAPKTVAGRGQPAYSPAMLAKVLLYAYLTGTFSSRKIERNCHESLPYLFLVRQDRPSYRTLCSARTDYFDYFLKIWLTLIQVAEDNKIPRLGQVAIDSTKFEANASRSSVVSAKDYEATIKQFEDVIQRAQQKDAAEDASEQDVNVSVGKDVKRLHVRDVVRSVGKSLPEGEVTPKTVERLKKGIETLKQAQADNLKHVSLTDPDSRIMPIGSHKRTNSGHALQVATDNGVVVASDTCNEAADTSELLPILAKVQENSPVPTNRVTADSGYYQGANVVQLLKEGIDVVIPSSTIASEMKKPNYEPPAVTFSRHETEDAFVCSQGQLLHPRCSWEQGGQTYREYRAARVCTGCPLASQCLKNKDAKRRSIQIPEHHDILVPYLNAFLTDPATRAKYHARGPAIETVFAYIRRVFGFREWHLRGAEKVKTEGLMVTLCVNILKMHKMNLKRA